jgi:DHA3 family macrolide efflux protein-like MFS transporter
MSDDTIHETDIDEPESNEPDTRRPPLGRRFLTVWIGQTVSEIGSMLSGVGAAIYVFVSTGSATWLGILAALAALPYLLTSPIATLIDRFPRRTVMIWADVGAACGPLFAVIMSLFGGLEVWHLAVAGFVGGLGNSLQAPASQAAVPALVDRDALGRANALKQFGPALGVVIGPVLAAPIVAWWGIQAVLLIDLATFLIGVGTVSLVRFDDQRDEHPVDDDGSWSMMWMWLSTDGRSLLMLMGATAVVNFVLAFFNVSLIALAADIAGPASAGLVLAVGGAAMIVGAIVAAQRGLPLDRLAAFSRGLVLMSLGLVVTAMRPSVAVVIVGVVIALGCVPWVNATMATVYNERVPASMQGRVFALRGAISQSLLPIGSALAGVTISGLAAPAIDDGGWLASSIGGLIGTGRERAPALVLLACAAALMVAAVVVWRSETRRELLVVPESTTGESSSGDELLKSEEDRAVSV